MTAPRQAAGWFDRIGAALFCVTSSFLLWLARAYVPNREFLPESEPALFWITGWGAGAALALALLFAWLPRLMTAAIYASMAVFMFFAAGHLRGGGDWPTYLVVMWLAGVAVLVWIVRREIPSRALIIFAGLTGYVFAASVATSVAGIARVAAATDPRPEVEPATRAVRHAGNMPPDIYILLFDGLGLRAGETPVDPGASQDLRALMADGFAIYDRAYANYPITFMSIASMVAGRHLGEGWSWSREMDTIRYANPLSHAAVEAGYRVTIYSGYGWTALCDPARSPWACVSPENDGRDPLLRNRERARQARTLITLTLMQLPRGESLARAVGLGEGHAGLRAFRTAHDDIQHRMAANGEPDFVFAHVIFPHGAAAVNADCSQVGGQLGFARNAYRDRDAYVRASDCAFRLMRQFTEALRRAGALDRSTVVFMADHGSSFHGQFDKPLEAWTEPEIQERFSTFFAIRPAGATTGGVVRRPLQLLDVAPGLMTMMGVQPPAEMEGRDFRTRTPSSIRVFLAGYEKTASYNDARFLPRDITFPPAPEAPAPGPAPSPRR